MSSTVARSVSLVSVAIAALLSIAPAEATVATVIWAEDRAGLLRIVFEGSIPPRLAVESDHDGPRIVLPGVSLAAPAPDDVRAEIVDGVTTLHVARSGASIAAVRSERGTLEIELRSDRSASPLDDYRLGPGDVVSVAVYEDEALSGEYTVGQDGSVNLPLVGAVRAIGATEADLAARIRDAVVDFIAEPTLSVTILRFESQSIHVNITGDAPRAAKVVLRPGMGLADVLSEAGVALLPLQSVRLTRTDRDGARIARTFTAEEIESDATPNPRDGDVVTVLEPEYVFVRGEVERAGRWIYRPGMTLQELIAMAGGLGEWANRKEIRILRRNGTDRSEEMNFNLRRIEEGRAKDPRLEPGDLVLVRRRVL